MTDKWLAEDKWNHLTGSFFITQLFGWVFGWVIAVILALACGFFIELWQEYRTIDKFSWKDIVADVIGIALAVMFITRGLR